MERKEMWWDSNNKAKYDRNYCGTFVNIFYVFTLITELILWVKVRNKNNRQRTLLMVHVAGYVDMEGDRDPWLLHHYHLATTTALSGVTSPGGASFNCQVSNTEL